MFGDHAAEDILPSTQNRIGEHPYPLAGIRRFQRRALIQQRVIDLVMDHPERGAVTGCIDVAVFLAAPEEEQGVGPGGEFLAGVDRGAGAAGEQAELVIGVAMAVAPIARSRLGDT